MSLTVVGGGFFAFSYRKVQETSPDAHRSSPMPRAAQTRRSSFTRTARAMHAAADPTSIRS